MPNRLKNPIPLLLLLVLACLNTPGLPPAERDCGTDELKASIAKYTKAIQFSKYDYLAHVGRGRAYLGLGDHDAALKDFNRAIEIQPKGDAAYYERGRLFRERSNTVRAVSDFTRAIELNPFNSDAYYFRAHAQWDGNKSIIIPDFSKAIELSPDDYSYYEARGMALLSLRLKEQAMLDLDKAIEMLQGEIAGEEKTPCDATAYIDRGYIFHALQRYPEALNDLNMAVKIDPTNFMAYRYRSGVLKFQRKYREALADLNKAIELNPNYADNYQDRAEIHEKLNWQNTAAADRQKYQTLSTSIPNM